MFSLFFLALLSLAKLKPSHKGKFSLSYVPIARYVPHTELFKGEGILNAAEQYIELAVAAYPDEADDLRAAADEIANPLDYPTDYTPTDGEEFDFIVIGSGSAGNVVVNRLTEVDSWNVLLIEAGGDPIKSIEVPALAATYLNTEIDWAYRTKPDGESCLGMMNGSCRWPRGKVLGGTSTFNYMLYVRGNKNDFDHWESNGCENWNYETVLKYFKKSEDLRSSTAMASSPEYHSTGGYLKVEDYHTFASKNFYAGVSKGLNEVGYDNFPDCNGFNQSVYADIQGTLIDGRRCSTAKGFLSPIRDRSNLKLTKFSVASKILIDNKNRAYGVEFIKDGVKITVKATKEVISSAGAINSPQLLMLSGIGPREHLESLDIDVVADLPVGENLQDHPLISSMVFTTNHTDTVVSVEETMYNFLKKKENVFSHIKSAGHTGFITTTGNIDWPECQFIMLSFPKNDTEALDYWLTGTVGLKTDLQQQIRDLNQEAYLSYPYCSYLRPYGRGKVELKSSDPLDHPILTTGYFSNEKDFDIMLGFYDFVENWINTDGMKSMDAKLHELEVPECLQKYTYKSRDYRMCALRYLTATTYHHCGSCKMGSAKDTTAVVDPSLRVKGVDGLRVCDASIMPTITNGNINAPTIMIGERCADFIKESWTSKYQKSAKLDDHRPSSQRKL